MVYLSVGPQAHLSVNSPRLVHSIRCLLQVVQSVWIRVLILWMVGSVLAVLLNHTQAENYVIVFPPSVPLYRFQSVLIHWFSSPWWMPLGGGAAAGEYFILVCPRQE